MNLAISKLYDERINMRKFFSAYFPNTEFTLPGNFTTSDTPEEDDKDDIDYGWLLPRYNFNKMIIKLGMVDYRMVCIFLDNKDVWTLGLVTPVTGILSYVQVNQVTPGWVNKYAMREEFYVKELQKEQIIIPG